MRHALLSVLLGTVMLTAWPQAAVVTAAPEVETVVTGIGYDGSVRGGRILQPTGTVTNLDWPVWVLIRLRNVAAGTQMDVTRTAPDGTAMWTFKTRWTTAVALEWEVFLMPIPGTPMEEKTGQWKIVFRFNDGTTREVPLTVTEAERSILDTLKADVQRSPDSFTANYRLGVAAGRFGEDNLAVTHLKKARRHQPAVDLPSRGPGSALPSARFEAAGVGAVCVCTGAPAWA